jgi:hypothetical protein
MLQVDDDTLFRAEPHDRRVRPRLDDGLAVGHTASHALHG